MGVFLISHVQLFYGTRMLYGIRLRDLPMPHCYGGICLGSTLHNLLIDIIAGNKGRNFSPSEINNMLVLGARYQPISRSQWDRVAQHQGERYPGYNQDGRSFKKMFCTLANRWAPTGDTHALEDVWLAKQLSHCIKDQTNVSTDDSGLLILMKKTSTVHNKMHKMKM